MASIIYKGFNMPIMPYPTIDNLEVTLDMDELQEDSLLLRGYESVTPTHWNVHTESTVTGSTQTHTLTSSPKGYRLVLRKKTGIHPYDLLKSLVLQKLVFNYTTGEEVWTDIETVIED